MPRAATGQGGQVIAALSERFHNAFKLSTFISAESLIGIFGYLPRACSNRRLSTRPTRAVV